MEQVTYVMNYGKLMGLSGCIHNVTFNLTGMEKRVGKHWPQEKSCLMHNSFHLSCVVSILIQHIRRCTYSDRPLVLFPHETISRKSTWWSNQRLY
jgi:hypothetical protein